MTNITFSVHHKSTPLLKIYNFTVGTCSGTLSKSKNELVVYSIINKNPGNGDLIPTLNWLFDMCIDDERNLIIMDVFNERFKKHLMFKYGFFQLANKHLFKDYHQIKKENYEIR